MRRFFLIAVVLAGVSLNSHADENQPASLDYVKRVGRDLVELPGLPFRWTGTQWSMAGGVAALTLGTMLFDGRIRNHTRRANKDVTEELSNSFKHFGDSEYQIPLQAGSWALGTIFNYEPLKKVAADGMEASLIAAGILNPLVTRMSGRSLPSYNERPMLFQPFTGHLLSGQKGHESFPSGHTAEAFTMAAVIDANFRQQFGYWQTPFLFALASATGISRVYDQKHYMSDVVLGAGIGTSVGYWIANKPRNVPKSSITVLPAPDGIRVTWEF